MNFDFLDFIFSESHSTSLTNIRDILDHKETYDLSETDILKNIIAIIYCEKRAKQLYSKFNSELIFTDDTKQFNFTANLKEYTKLLSADNDEEKVLIFLLLSIINQFFYKDVIENENDYDFVFDFPLDVIFMVSISDITPAFLSLMNILTSEEYEYAKDKANKTNSGRKNNQEKDKKTNFFHEYSEILDFIFFYIDEDDNNIKIEEAKEKDDKKISIQIEKHKIIKQKLQADNQILKKEFDINDVIQGYLRFHIPIWKKNFLDLLQTLSYQDLIEIAYLSTPDEDNLLINAYFIKRFITDDSYRSVGIHDMINFSNDILNDFHRLSPESNTEESKFFENAILKILGYFIDITNQSYSPFLSSKIYETVYKLKKVLPKGEIRQKVKEAMTSIVTKTNNIKMSSDQQKESLPYYFLDLSGAPLHKLMELNPKTIIPFTLSPYLLKKDLPNIEVLIQTQNKIDKCQDKFDSTIFSCSPTADSTIAVVRDIFVEYDPITERLTDHNAIKKRSIYQEKQTSPLPGMLIFKLSMLQWDFMPNFTIDMDFVPVFQVPYNSINKYALKRLENLSFINNQEKEQILFYLDLHTADCNLCFYPLTESERDAIGRFFKEQIRIEEYSTENLKRHFLDKTKSEMIQTASNYIPNMIVKINKEKKWPKYPPDSTFDPNTAYDTEKSQSKKDENPYLIMFKDFGSGNRNDVLEKLEGVVEKLCNSDSTVLLLESVCYLCQKEPACASKVLDLLEKELKSADEHKRILMLTIIDRIVDPAILQNQTQLIDQARQLTETLQFLCKKTGNTIDPGELGKKVMNISKGSHFFSLSSEERKEKLGFDNVHREWLMNSIPNNDIDEND